MSLIVPTTPPSQVPGIDVDSTNVSLSRLLEHAATKYGHSEAVVSKWQQPWSSSEAEDTQPSKDCLRWSYKALFQAAKRMSATLQEAGVKPGNVICIASTTSIEWTISLWASILGNFVFMPIDPSMAANVDGIQNVLADIGPAVFIVSDMPHAKALDEASEGRPLLKITLNDETNKIASGGQQSWSHFSALVASEPLPVSRLSDANRQYEDVLLICYTSGTTALPKACPISGSNIISSVLAMQEAGPLNNTDRLLHHLPSFVSMSMILLLHVWSTGGAVVFPAQKFDPISTLRGIDEERCTYLCTVPPIVKFMCSVPGFSQFKTDTLRAAVLSGSPATVQALAQCLDKLKADQVGFGWGMTECGAILFSDFFSDVTDLSPDKLVMKSPKSGVGIKICDPGSDNLVQYGQVGELHVCARSVIHGYLNNNIVNASPFYEEAGQTWLRTGDLATLDPSGGIRIAGRLKDLIIRGGVNIAPVKIESQLNHIEGVAVQVVGCPDEVAGEVPVAVIWDQRKPTSADRVSHRAIVTQLQQSALTKLDSNMIPVAWINLSDLRVPGFPVTPAGKPKKAALAALARQYPNERRTP